MVSIPVRARESLGYLAVYAVAVLLGLMSLRQGTGPAFFWPAAGVGTLWMLHGRTPRQVVLDGTLLVAATTILDALMGIPWAAACLFGLANLVVGLTVRATSALLEGLPFWGALPRRVAGKRDLGALGAASLAAALASAPIGLTAVYVSTGSLDWGTAAAWVVRNTCSTFVVVASVLAALTTLYRAHARRGWAAKLTSEPRRLWRTELLAAVAIAVGTAVFLFGSTQQLPIAFLIMAPATWLGYRFSPAVGGGFAMLVSTLGVLCTQAGRGPFAPIEDFTARAVTVQVFVLVITVLVLVLGLGVAERSALIARVVESEARATSRAELLDAVMNAITDGLVVLDSAGSVMMRNDAAVALAGNRQHPGRMGSLEDHGFFQPDGTTLAKADLPHVRALQGEVVSSEDLLRIEPDTGHQATLSVSAVPLRNETSGESLAVLVIHDVTQERTHRRELQAFAGTVAHDLKAPLTGVGSWAEILGDQLDALGVDVTEPKSSLRKIESSAVRMQQLIADLLAYSQAQSAVLRPTPLSLTGVVEDVARELREASTGGPAPLIEHGPLGRVLADRMLVGQLLVNVIGNAAKYVAPGTRPHVVVSSSLVGTMLEVRIADNGIGIPRGERGRIFDSFYRASSSGSYPGTGLGLAICARAVERHGGRISAREGRDGTGTTIVFTLPADLDPADLDPADLDPADLDPADLDPADLDPGAEWTEEDQRLAETTSADPPPRRVGSDTAVS